MYMRNKVPNEFKILLLIGFLVVPFSMFPIGAILAAIILATFGQAGEKVAMNRGMNAYIGYSLGFILGVVGLLIMLIFFPKHRRANCKTCKGIGYKKNNEFHCNECNRVVAI